MAVEDIVARLIGSNQRADQTFQKPQEDNFFREMLGMYVDYQDKKNVQDRQELADILDLTKLVNTEEGFKNLDSTINNFSPTKDSLNPAYNTIKSAAATKKNNYYRGKSAMDDISNNLDSYEKYSQEDMQNWSIDKLKDEMLRVADVKDNMDIAISSGFNYSGSNITSSRASRAVNDYNAKLGATFKALATEGVVTEEEAEAIFLGEYDAVKKNVTTSSLQQIKALDTDIDSLLRELRKSQDEGIGAFLAKNLTDSQDKDKQAEDFNQYNLELKKEIELKRAQKQQNIKRYNSWSIAAYNLEDTIDEDEMAAARKAMEEAARKGVSVETEDLGGQIEKKEETTKTKEEIKEDSKWSPEGHPDDVVIATRKGRNIMGRPIPENFLNKAFNEDSFDISEGKVKEGSEILNFIDYEIGRLKSRGYAFTGKSERKDNPLSVSDLKSLKDKMNKYAKKLKRLKQTVGAGKKVPQSLRNEINKIIEDAKSIYSQTKKTGPIDYSRSAEKQNKDEIRETIRKIEEELLAKGPDGIVNINNMNYPFREKLKEIRLLKEKLK